MAKRFTPQEVIDYTTERLKGWYITAKRDFNIDGSGVASLKDGDILISYSEDGVQAEFSVNYWESENIDFAFNVWMEFADLDGDRI